MKRRSAWLAIVAVVACAAASPAADTPSAERPNILCVVSEDTDCLLGCYGDPHRQTPTLDRLASDGVLFERCFTMPVCAPSRFTLISGMYSTTCGPAHHMRAQGNIVGLPAREIDHQHLMPQVYRATVPPQPVSGSSGCAPATSTFSFRLGDSSAARASAAAAPRALC